MVSTRTLANIAACGGVIVVSTGVYLKSKVIERYQGAQYYKEALRRLRRNAAAVHHLGEPIKDRKFKITDSENNYCDDKKDARFKVPVRGPKDQGWYYFWATKVGDEWRLIKAELELKSQPDRRLVIIKTEELSNKVE